MMHPDNPRDVLLLDACVILNLFATRRHVAVLEAIEGPIGVVAAVRREALWVLRGGEGDDASEPEPVDLDSVVTDGLVRQIDPTEAELDAFLGYSRRLGDGEAMTAAVAIARGWAVATDDRKARSLLTPHVRCRSTLDLVKEWSDIPGIGHDELVAILRDLRRRGRFLPRRTDPLWAWWHEHVPNS